MAWPVRPLYPAGHSPHLSFRRFLGLGQLRCVGIARLCRELRLLIRLYRLHYARLRRPPRRPRRRRFGLSSSPLPIFIIRCDSEMFALFSPTSASLRIGCIIFIVWCLCCAWRDDCFDGDRPASQHVQLCTRERLGCHPSIKQVSGQTVFYISNCTAFLIQNEKHHISVSSNMQPIHLSFCASSSMERS